MPDDDLHFGNNGDEDILDPRPGRVNNQGINAPPPPDVHEHDNIGGPHVGRVPEASTVGAAQTCVDRTEAYYRIQNLKILKQCKKYKDSLFECQSSLKVATDALKVALQRNDAIPDYLDIIKIKVMFLSQGDNDY